MTRAQCTSTPITPVSSTSPATTIGYQLEDGSGGLMYTSNLSHLPGINQPRSALSKMAWQPTLLSRQPEHVSRVAPSPLTKCHTSILETRALLGYQCLFCSWQDRLAAIFAQWKAGTCFASCPISSDQMPHFNASLCTSCQLPTDSPVL